jgi:hypothetical protein
MKVSDCKWNRVPDGLRAELPQHLGTFLGRPIGVETDERRPPDTLRQPDTNDLKLLGKILASLPQILRKAELEFQRYELDRDPAFWEHLCNPHIWIDPDKHSDNWTFVVERADSPDYGCHIEFRGHEFQRIWAGD